MMVELKKKILAVGMALTALVGIGINAPGTGSLTAQENSPVKAQPQVVLSAPEVHAPAPVSSSPAQQVEISPASTTTYNAPVRYDNSMYPAENQKVVDKWYSLGASNGILGEPISYLTCSQGGDYCYEEFMGGDIYTMRASNTAFVLLRTSESNLWNQRNPNSVRFTSISKDFSPALGWPAGNSVCNGDICNQQFTNSWVYSSKSNGAGQILMKADPATGLYQAMGAHNGPLGYPVTNNTGSGAGLIQKFQNGNIYTLAGKTQVILKSSFVFNKYASMGGETGILGYPMGAVTGQYQKFQNGAIYSVPAGVISVEGSIYSAYKSLGAEAGTLGLPTGAKVVSGSNSYQSFVNGKVYSSSTGTQVFLKGKTITDKYNALGAETGTLGYPVGNETCMTDGCYQKFETGLIAVSPAGSVFTVVGSVYSVYNDAGNATGYLGLPLGDATIINGQTLQRFKGGTVAGDASFIRAYENSECDTLSNGKSKYSANNANRVTFAVAESYGTYQATVLNCKKVAGVYLMDWKTYGTVGQNGFKAPGVPSGPTRFEYSPTGSYSITEAFGLSNPGTALPYKTLNPNSRWGGNPNSGYYNQYVEYSNSAMGYDEDMWYLATRPQHDYQQGAVINYNRLPDSQIVQDAGFAIFLHENPVPTAGCVAIDHESMVRWLQTAQPGDRIIMGVRADLFNS